MNYLHVTDNKV